MTVQDIMTTDVETIAPDTPMRSIAKTMRDRDVGVLPIVRDGKLEGVVTDRDLVVRGLVDESRSIDDLTAAKLMSEKVLSVGAGDSLEEARNRMQDGAVRRLAVTDGNRKLLGMISLGDLAKHAKNDAGEALESITKAA